MSIVTEQGQASDPDDVATRIPQDYNLFHRSMKELGWDKVTQHNLMESLIKSGLVTKRTTTAHHDDVAEDYDSGSSTTTSWEYSSLWALCQDYPSTHLATMLMNDFHIQPPLLAHQLRATIVRALQIMSQEEAQEQQKQDLRTSNSSPKRIDTTAPPRKQRLPASKPSLPQSPAVAPDTIEANNAAQPKQPQRALFKSVHVNAAALSRKQNPQAITYGLPKNYAVLHPILATELQQFYTYLTQPSTVSNEEPIRDATAIVYVRHAKLYLGWYLQYYHSSRQQSIQSNTTIVSGKQEIIADLQNHSWNGTTVSLQTIFPSSDANAATPLIEFVLWLRQERSISSSYEANVLRGLSKLIKFRFATTSNSSSSSNNNHPMMLDAKHSQSYPGMINGDTTTGGSGSGSSSSTTSSSDLPILIELRKLHRVANRNQKMAPKSSNEKLKWISWPQYLMVVQDCYDRYQQLLQSYHNTSQQQDIQITSSKTKKKAKLGNVTALTYTSQEREIAVALQKYLILAILASVPDRQRTVRELQVGRTLLWNDDDDHNLDTTHGGYWCIKHAPEDYKTGKTYGERPLLQLPHHLTKPIQEFHSTWRKCLKPQTNRLFVQPRTGQALTSNSVYQIVSRCCYERTGKRTNPHLLRDMIVTHVRDSSEASEQQLEALALYMGHSLHMQRTSYDRRTLTRKVAPAIQLLNTVNQVPNTPNNGATQQRAEFEQ